MMIERQRSRLDGSGFRQRAAGGGRDRRRSAAAGCSVVNTLGKYVGDGDGGEEAVARQQRLDIIDLSGMSLNTILPNLTLNLAAICKLDLSNNNLQSIPESLTARLLNVVVLDVHSNQLSSLPNSIGCLSKLKVLNVSGNLLSSLPKAVLSCGSLEELIANFNKLSSLPDTMGFELLNLKKLSVNCNKLMLLPYSTSHLTALRVLDVRLNCLRSLPDDLENLINLETLNLSQNFHNLTELPYSIGLLLSLVELDVSYNNLSTLPPSLGCLNKLRKLSVEGNPLVSPPIDVVDLGLHAVRQYLTDRINGTTSASTSTDHQSSYHQINSFPYKNKKKKSSWFSRLRKAATINGRARVDRSDDQRSFALLDHYRPIKAIASPRYLGMFSPTRLFSSSPKSKSKSN